MATVQIPILGWGTVPDNSDEVFFEPFTVLASNDVWGRLICRFGSSNSEQPTVRMGLRGGFVVPQDYVDTANIVIVWTATLTAGNVVWDFDYRAVGGNDAESLDQAGTQESVSVTDAAPGTAYYRLAVTVAVTDGNFAAGDEVEFELFRDGTDGSDTMAGSAILFQLLFEYANA
jgi:hypothetical protein